MKNLHNDKKMKNRTKRGVKDEEIIKRWHLAFLGNKDCSAHMDHPMCYTETTMIGCWIGWIDFWQCPLKVHYTIFNGT